MFDPTAQVTVGGALLVVIWMLLKFKPWRNNNKTAEDKKVEYRATTSGEQAPGYWSAEFRKIIDECLANYTSKRNEEIRRIIREELGNTLKGRL